MNCYIKFLLITVILIQCHHVPQQSFAQEASQSDIDQEYFQYIEYVSCYDGDTCKFNIANLNDVFGKKLPIVVELTHQKFVENVLKRRNLHIKQETLFGLY